MTCPGVAVTVDTVEDTFWWRFSTREANIEVSRKSPETWGFVQRAPVSQGDKCPVGKLT